MESIIILIAKLLVAYIGTITPMIVYTNLTAAIFNHYKLKKISKCGYIISNQIPKPIKVDKIEMDKKLYNFVLPYIEKLKNYTNEENLNTLYKNLQTLKISKPTYLTAIYYSGLYNSVTNEIECITENSFGHELLHAATSYYDPKTKISYVGFKQSKGDTYIGKGLNEGYTELLASRLYNKNNKLTTYKKEAKIARLFEFFFNDPKEMEKYYFNHDLPGFIYHMQRFSSRKEVIDLLLNIDKIYDYSFTIGSFLPTYNSIKTQLTLYNWFERNCKDPAKLQEFRNVVCENKMVEIILTGKKAILQRPKPIQATPVMAR